VLPIGLGVIGLREADDELAVFPAFLDEGRSVGRTREERERSDPEREGRGSTDSRKKHDSLPWFVDPVATASPAHRRTCASLVASRFI
jgi:hypothetical protein